MTDVAEESSVAVIGLAGRFPGTNSVAGFWAALASGTELITHFPADVAGGDAAACGIVPDADAFDSAFFGFAPSEALVLDPQQRVFLECAWEALEDAGYDPAAFSGTIGVYAGASETDHVATVRANRARFPGVSEWWMRLMATSNLLTSRTAYKLGLTGPAINIQSACSTSLVAVHVAVQALLGGECDMALAGGITLRVPAVPAMPGDDGLGSSDGHCRAFDAAASGPVPSDGAGIVVLRRLDDALADEDHIRAVIRGSAVTNDGSAKVGFTTPSVDGQAAAVRAAHLAAGIDPFTISYVEAHGTATPVGDPIEVRALSKAFGTGAGAPARCLLGSVKSNIGHADVAAGVLGLIKVVLALENELLPGTVHFRVANPEIDFRASPFTVSSTARPWPRAPVPRRAGVNSVGVGGTNAYVVVEEAPAVSRPGPCADVPQVLPLSARTATALRESRLRLADYLTGHPGVALGDVAWTLQMARRSFAHRGYVVCADVDAAVSALRAEHDAADRSISPGLGSERSSAKRVTFMFPGFGGQHSGMARQLYERWPVFRAEIDHCAELAAPALGIDLRSVLVPEDADAATEAMSSTLIGHPAVFAVEYALARLWASLGVIPTMVAGHSLGTYAAATIAGVLALPDALGLVLERARLLSSLRPGAMLAVRLPEQKVVPMLSGTLTVAVVNGPDQCVVAGFTEDISMLHDRLAREGTEGKVLNIGISGHSPLTEPILEYFGQAVSRVRRNAPSIPWISDQSGLAVSPEEVADPGYWTAHLRQTVRFEDTLRTVLNASDDVLLEVGPGRTLIELARRHSACDARRRLVATVPRADDSLPAGVALLAAAGSLWQAGVPVRWEALHQGQACRRIPLPAYPFERQRFCLEGPNEAAPQAAADASAIAFECPELSRELVAPAGPTQRSLATIFRAVLGHGQVGIHDNFFDLGGDSLFASQIVAAVRRELGAAITIRAIYQAPTIAQLADLVDRHDSDSDGGDLSGSREQPWLLSRQRRPGAPMRLYCFPPSGAMPGEYMRWSDHLPDVEVWGIQLPGRGSRWSEPALTTMAELVTTLVEEVSFTPPFAFFGHSFGALVAYETTLALRERGLASPQQLCLSAFHAPHLHPAGQGMPAADGAELLPALLSDPGISCEELDRNPELQQSVLGSVRSDLGILGGYRASVAQPLACPLLVLGGTDDDLASEEQLAAWEPYTTGMFRLRRFSGGHYYFRENLDDVLQLVRTTLGPATA
jgi:phthiocerol/phenolphthiocerol synthesis type-I polyketide synthase E